MRFQNVHGRAVRALSRPSGAAGLDCAAGRRGLRPERKTAANRRGANDRLFLPRVLAAAIKVAGLVRFRQRNFVAGDKKRAAASRGAGAGQADGLDEGAKLIRA